jgi:hypothetical protein
MRTSFHMALLFLLMAVSSPAKSEAGVTIGQMAEHCQRPDGDFFRTYCFTYVAAVMDAHSVFGLRDGTGRLVACVPDAVLARQASAVFVKWAAENPERHHEPAVLGIVSSWANAFPCQQP